ncbi:single-stranded-DNA-specific exonuclease [Natronospira proteinivora]|uniref:Single-stranded-DNA-specific exonuclease RecJ n=1 Tax=Natronospira proteinivora TaxID=1807133 RepID=A0ABT1G5T0_9GAMM|nr:single-stranded-DNA-specific exonuclease RecJ [Natronospira proteinivora]MCP1726654.1 single-stranded-DNA-specific exonuclease [Natronospira proteinivora]
MSSQPPEYASRIRRRSVDTLRGLSGVGHPVLRRVYAARGIQSESELRYSTDQLASPDSLAGLSDAVRVLFRHLRKGRILIVGDFDADGATSTALLLSALKEGFGATQVDYLVPNRFEFGYGLSPELVDVAAEQSPTLIITVDNGISSIEGVARAKRLGMEVLITDHHLPGENLPEAEAIVNPVLPGSDFPSPNLAGVGVVFYLLLALRRYMREKGAFQERGLSEPRLAEWLDLVALGTVADLVPLDRNNRLLVHQGLQRIRSGRLRPGLDALIRVAGRNRADLAASDLAFAVAPRLNAAGRLDDMSHGIETLLCQDADRAWEGAMALDAMNHRRRDIEQSMQTQAERAIERLKLPDSQGLPEGLTLYQPDWHSGIVGLVASRMKERFHRPVAAFARNENGSLKGSLRSVPGIHIRDVLADIDTCHPGLIERFGGHAMAAGLTLAPEGLSRFREAFQSGVAQRADADKLAGVILSDGELAPNEFSLELAEQLRRGGPWGQGFPEPLFDGEFFVLEQRIVGERHLKCRLQHPDVATPIDAIAFNPDPFWLDALPERIRIAYSLDVNEWRGLRRPQLLIKHIERI